MDQSHGVDKYDGRQQTTKRSQLREILDDLDRQDRALLRVSTDLLETIAVLQEAHELSLRHGRMWTSPVVRDTGTAGTGPAATVHVTGGAAEVWACSTEKSG